MQKIIGVTEMQRNFRRVFDDVAEGHIPYVLTRGSRPEAALIPYDAFLQLMALLDQGEASKVKRLAEDVATYDVGDAGERSGMPGKIAIEIPADVEQALNRTPAELARDVRLYSALMLFNQDKLSSSKAASMAGVSRVEFLHLCGEYGIPVLRTDPDDLDQELKNVLGDEEDGRKNC